jgi:hypothetical protein
MWSSVRKLGGIDIVGLALRLPVNLPLKLASLMRCRDVDVAGSRS